MKKLLFFTIGLCCLISGLHAQPPTIQWQKSLGGTDVETGDDIKGTPDGGCIVVGSSGSYDGDVTGNHGNGDGWIVKLDANGDIEWERTVGGSSNDLLRGVALTSDGGYIAVGTTQSDDGDVTNFHGGFLGNNIWVLKFDSQGNIEWNNCYGGTGSDYGQDNISQTSDGGYIFAGSTSSTDGDVTGLHPGAFPWFSDIWVVKIDATGALQWQKCLGGSKNEFPSSVLETPDHGTMVYGTTWGSYDGDVIGNTDTVVMNSTPFSVWIVRLDSLQNIVWQKTYGGSGWDDAFGDLIPEDNGYTFAALTSSEDGDVIGYHGTTGSLAKDFWLVRINDSGIIQWQQCFGGDSSVMNSGDFVKTPDGAYAMAGEFFGKDSDFPSYHEDSLSTLSTDYVVVQCDSVGNLMYQHCYGSYMQDPARALAVAADGGLLVSGTSGGNNGDVSGHHGPLNIDDVWVLKLFQITMDVNEPVNQVKPPHAFKVYPNPVSTAAKIAFYLPTADRVTVKVYDSSGKEIKTLMDEYADSGFQQLVWDCTTDQQQIVSNGIFIVRIAAGENAAYTKVIVIR